MSSASTALGSALVVTAAAAAVALTVAWLPVAWPPDRQPAAAVGVGTEEAAPARPSERSPTLRTAGGEELAARQRPTGAVVADPSKLEPLPPAPRPGTEAAYAARLRERQREGRDALLAEVETMLASGPLAARVAAVDAWRATGATDAWMVEVLDAHADDEPFSAWLVRELASDARFAPARDALRAWLDRRPERAGERSIAYVALARHASPAELPSLRARLLTEPEPEVVAAVERALAAR